MPTHLLITQLTAPNQTANHSCLLISFSRETSPTMLMNVAWPIQPKSSTGPFFFSISRTRSPGQPSSRSLVPLAAHRGPPVSPRVPVLLSSQAKLPAASLRSRTRARPRSALPSCRASGLTASPLRVTLLGPTPRRATLPLAAKEALQPSDAPPARTPRNQWHPKHLASPARFPCLYLSAPLQFESQLLRLGIFPFPQTASAFAMSLAPPPAPRFHLRARRPRRAAPPRQAEPGLLLHRRSPLHPRRRRPRARRPSCQRRGRRRDRRPRRRGRARRRVSMATTSYGGGGALRQVSLRRRQAERPP